MSLNTTPRTWVSGEVVTAAELNAEVRDAFIGVQAAWGAYTPAWTAGTTNPTLGNGTAVGRFFRQGKVVDFLILITVGSTSTVGAGGYTFSLPVTGLQGNHSPVGVGSMFDTSAATDFVRVCLQNSTTLVQLNDMAGVRVSAVAPAVPAVGDILTATGTYEAA